MLLTMNSNTDFYHMLIRKYKWISSCYFTSTNRTKKKNLYSESSSSTLRSLYSTPVVIINSVNSVYQSRPIE